MATKAIIFDCFGVLASEGLVPFCAHYFGHNPSQLNEAGYLGTQVNSGRMPYTEFIARLANMAGVSESRARSMIENNIPDDSLFDYIARELKPKYKIGLLSNAADNWLDELFSPPQVALFDAVALSYHVGYIKPEPEIYLEIARQLAVDPSECLFIDDNLRYCVGARQVGMTAIHHRGSGDLSHQINQALD